MTRGRCSAEHPLVRPHDFGDTAGQCSCGEKANRSVASATVIGICVRRIARRGGRGGGSRPRWANSTSCLPGCCPPGASRCRGRKWRPCSRSRGSARSAPSWESLSIGMTPCYQGSGINEMAMACVSHARGTGSSPVASTIFIGNKLGKFRSLVATPSGNMCPDTSQ